MSLFVIADLHLSLNGEKPMDVFRGWHNYVERLEDNWRRVVQEGDTVVIAGDISWAMKLEDAVQDFQFLHSLPGEKILLKGNHDYWWSTRSKIDQFLAEHGFFDMKVLHNCAYQVEGKALCGTRGWLYNSATAEDKKIVAREAGRLSMSMAEAKKLGGAGGVSPLPAGVRQHGVPGASGPAGGKPGVPLLLWAHPRPVRRPEGPGGGI